MGAYNAFLDLTLGVGSPLLGFLAGKAGIASVFDVSASAAVLAVPIALPLRAETSRSAMVSITPQTRSLRRLGVETIDLLYQHRVDGLFCTPRSIDC
jgi:hypothetical protein